MTALATEPVSVLSAVESNGKQKKLRARYIVRATPTLGAVSIWWTKAVEDILWPMNYIKGVDYQVDSNGGEVAEMRNKIVARVLGFEDDRKEMAAIFWVDDDVIVTRGALMQLMSHDKPMVSGVYFTKLPGKLSEPLIFPNKGGGTDRFVPAPSDEERSYEVWGHGMGLTLVKADVYRRMRDELKLPLDKYGNPEWYRTTGRAEDITVEDGVIGANGTEDLFFCENAAKLGYKPLIDCSKHAFGFHYDLSTGKCYPEEQWKQYQNRKPIVWQTPDGPVTWE
jgi:hypothetical protein